MSSMDLLILGGTRFLGRHLVEIARRRGHKLTLFNRGRTNPTLFPDVEQVYGDRATDLDRLAGRRWDAVIDTSGYLPAVVSASARTLADAVEHYSFISTISVYQDFSAPHMGEDAPLARLEQPEEATLTNETYGALKTHCEDAVQAALPGRALIIRPGLIVGPYDPTGRFTYWPVRMAQGGEVLAPESPHLPVQFIDARDLAEWTLQSAEQRLTGIYNATGPATSYTLGALLDECNTVAQSDASVTWVPSAFLAEHQVQPWSDLPLWAPAEMPGLMTTDCSKAIAAGLRFRPVRETVADTLTWYRSLPDAPLLKAGLSREREAAVLSAWHERT